MQPSERDEAVRIAVEGCVLYREETGKLILISLDDPCWTELLRVAAAHPVVQARVLEAAAKQLYPLTGFDNQHDIGVAVKALVAGTRAPLKLEE